MFIHLHVKRRLTVVINAIFSLVFVMEQVEIMRTKRGNTVRDLSQATMSPTSVSSGHIR